MRKTDLEALGRRLRDARKDARLTQTHVAERLKCSKQLISHYERGRVNDIPISAMREFAIMTGVSLDWLLLAKASTVSPNLRVGGRLVPKLTETEIIELARGQLELDDVVEQKFTQSDVSDRALWFNPVDEGMAPEFVRGRDAILVDTGLAPQPGDCVAVVLLKSSRFLFRRYRPHDGSKPGLPPYDLMSDNPSWPTVMVTRADGPVFIGTMVESNRVHRRPEG